MGASNYFRHALCTNMYLLSPSPYTEKDYKFSIFTVCMFYDLCTYKLYIWRIVYRNWSQKAAIFWFKFTRYLVRNTQVFISSLPGKTFSFDFVIDEGQYYNNFHTSSNLPFLCRKHRNVDNRLPLKSMLIRYSFEWQKRSTWIIQ